jgi:hypothetical protein
MDIEVILAPSMDVRAFSYQENSIHINMHLEPNNLNMIF